MVAQRVSLGSTFFLQALQGLLEPYESLYLILQTSLYFYKAFYDFPMAITQHPSIKL
jgi:hypothetical protein